MTPFRAFALTGCLTLLTWAARAQDAPMGALPTQFNGSFAGEAGSPRASTSFVYRTLPEWLPNPNGQILDLYTYRVLQASTAYDQFIPALRSGVGIATSHTYGTAAYRTFNAHSVNLAVAPKFSVGGKYTFSPSLDVEYGRLQQTGKEHPVITWMNDYEGHWVRGRVGVLFNTDTYYLGYSVFVQQRFTSQRGPNGGRWSGKAHNLLTILQLGYTFGNNTRSRFSFTPQLALRIGPQDRNSPHSSRDVRDGDSRIRGIGVEALSLGFRYRQFLWGVNNLGVHVGWQTERLRVMVTNNVAWISGGFEYRPYTANLSLRYVFKGEG